MVFRDGIREGDGNFLMSMWRHNMLEFWQHNHPRYLLIGHRLLAGEANYITHWLQTFWSHEVTLWYMLVYLYFTTQRQTLTMYPNHQRCRRMAAYKVGQRHYTQPNRESARWAGQKPSNGQSV